MAAMIRYKDSPQAFTSASYKASSQAGRILSLHKRASICSMAVITPS